MKKTLVYIFVSISILFFILTFTYTIYQFFSISKISDSLVGTSNNIQEVTITSNMSYPDSLKLSYCNGMLTILHHLFTLLIISCIFGTLLGFILSTSEFSKIKYLLYLIFINILYNTIMGAIIQYIYQQQGIEFTFFESFLQSFITTFPIYFILSLVFILIIYLINKKKINTLNKELQK